MAKLKGELIFNLIAVKSGLQLRIQQCQNIPLVGPHLNTK
jgi:hypothetical protein